MDELEKLVAQKREILKAEKLKRKSVVKVFMVVPLHLCILPLSAVASIGLFFFRMQE